MGHIMINIVLKTASQFVFHIRKKLIVIDILSLDVSETCYAIVTGWKKFSVWKTFLRIKLLNNIML